MVELGDVGGVLGGAADPDPSAGSAAFPIPPGSVPEMDSAPGQVTRHEVRRELLNGAIIRFLAVESTRLVGSDFVSEHLDVLPTNSCNCTPESIDDAYLCSDSECGAVTCSRHTWTCGACGQVHCSNHSVAVECEGVVAVVCVRCSKPKRGLFSYLCRFVGGLLG